MTPQQTPGVPLKAASQVPPGEQHCAQGVALALFAAAAGDAAVAAGGAGDVASCATVDATHRRSATTVAATGARMAGRGVSTARALGRVYWNVCPQQPTSCDALCAIIYVSICLNGTRGGCINVARRLNNYSQHTRVVCTVKPFR